MLRLRFYLIIFLVTATPALVGLVIYYKNYSPGDRNPLVKEAEKLTGLQFDLTKFEKFETVSTETGTDNERLWVTYLVSGCEACRKLLPLAEKIQQEPNSHVKIIGIMAESDEAVEHYIEDNGIKFPVLHDSQAAFMKSVNLRYFPTSFLVNNGIISKAFFGVPRNEDAMRSFLQD